MDDHLKDLRDWSNTPMATRLSPDDIDAAIKDEQYYVFPGTTLTVCCFTLSYGFCVVGESACLDPENFDAEVGHDVARRRARDKVRALEGYLRLHDLKALDDA